MSGMRVSEFMLQLGKQLQATREISESSANQYLQTLHSLHNKTPFNNLSWLKSHDSVNSVLNTFAPATQRGYITAIVSCLSLFKDKPTYKKTYKYWYDKMMEAKENSDKPANTKSDKQDANWVEWEEVQKIKSALATEVSKVATGKHITPSGYDTLLRFVVLSLYTDIAPRRNQDYMDMYVVKKWDKELPKDKNYLDLASGRFIFNKYKTAKTYGEQIEEIPNTEDKPLLRAIQLLLKYHPLNKPKVKEYKFLVAHDGSPLNSVNAITRMLNKVFGKKVGSSMLRHIYLTGKYGNQLDEMKKDAEAMGHSVSEQKEYVLTK
jgi:integrase